MSTRISSLSRGRDGMVELGCRDGGWWSERVQCTSVCAFWARDNATGNTSFRPRSLTSHFCSIHSAVLLRRVACLPPPHSVSMMSAMCLSVRFRRNSSGTLNDRHDGAGQSLSARATTRGQCRMQAVLSKLWWTSISLTPSTQIERLSTEHFTRINHEAEYNSRKCSKGQSRRWTQRHDVSNAT